MSYLTGLALKRQPVTLLVIVMLLAGGVFTFRSLPQELFPEIEFPIVTVISFYPSANPGAVERDITEPIESAIAGTTGVKAIQSTSSEGRSVILANFEFGNDMAAAEREIEAAVSGLSLPSGALDPFVTRIGGDVFPVLQLSVLGDRDIVSLQRLVEDLVIPQIESVEGVSRVDVIGTVDEQVIVTLDTARMQEARLSAFQVSGAIRDNNLSFPGGDISYDGVSLFVRTTHQFDSIEEIGALVVGFERTPGPPGVPTAVLTDKPIMLSDVAEVSLGTGAATTISRTNGLPSLGLMVIKEPDANTVDVTREALSNLESVELPQDVQIVTLFDDGPEVEAQLDILLQEGLLGFLFAMAVVFAFLINLRPTLLRGMALTLRATAVIGLSIPLSILIGIIMMGAAGLSLNFMTLAGLAIAVGRVVDDSIVVLENIYRHIQRGEDRYASAFGATKEVAAAIVASTLTTVSVFVPLAFIQGLVGSFFLPFTLAVSFALIASTFVALAAVPVLGAILLRRNNGATAAGGDDDLGVEHTILQRAYAPLLRWSLRHKLAAVTISLVVSVASLGLIPTIPVALFPAAPPEFITVDVTLPPGSSIEKTFEEASGVETVLGGLDEVELYQTNVGGIGNDFGPGGSAGAGSASMFVRLHEGAPDDFAEDLRMAIPTSDSAVVNVTELSNGPPTSGLELIVTGSDFGDVVAVAERLVVDLRNLDGLANVSSDVSEARDEIVINVDPERAAAVGLTTASVGLQVNQFILGQPVTEVVVDGVTMDVVVKGRGEDVSDTETLSALMVQGPGGPAPLNAIADVRIEQGPVSISRYDGERSVTVSGDIVADDTQAVGLEVQAVIDALNSPPGVDVRTGGIFEQIAEGFQDIFVSMIIGIALVYLVMVASLGSLRNPFVIITSLPLALVGALLALAITGRTLSLPALMGFLLLIGVVVTNAIVLIAFVQQLRDRGYSLEDSLYYGGLVRLRPILMTAFTTNMALLPLAVATSSDSGLIGAEMATVVIGGLISSTFLTLVFVPVVYSIMHEGLPNFLGRVGARVRRVFAGLC